MNLWLPPQDILETKVMAWSAKNAPEEAFDDLEGSVENTTDRFEWGRSNTGGPTLEELVPELPSRLEEALLLDDGLFWA